VADQLVPTAHEASLKGPVPMAVLSVNESVPALVTLAFQFEPTSAGRMLFGDFSFTTTVCASGA
jgi:hypothetical protein